MEIRLFCADLQALEDPALFRQLYEGVSETRRAKVDRIRTGLGRLQSLGAGALLEASLAELGVRAPCPVEDANGKPCLPGRTGLCFNLSHSGAKVLCAVSDRDIGCDVERIRAARLKLAQRYFCAEEYEALLRCGEGPARDALFYRYWTLKESFLKAVGTGLRIPLNAFCVLLEASGITLRQQVDPRHFELRDFTAEGYRFAVCSAERPLDGLCLRTRDFTEIAALLR